MLVLVLVSALHGYWIFGIGYCMLGIGINITLNRCDINISWNEMEKRKQKKWNTGNEGAGKRGYETSVMRGQNIYVRYVRYM